MFRTLLFLFHSFVTIVNGGYNDNIQFIQDHNSNQSSYEVGINQFINRNYSNGSYSGMYSYLPKKDIPTLQNVYFMRNIQKNNYPKVYIMKCISILLKD